MSFQVHVAQGTLKNAILDWDEHRPVIVLTKIGDDGLREWQRQVYKVTFTGRAWSGFAMQPRFGAHVWIQTDDPVQFLDTDDVWKEEA
jgi:hypothetical protein